MLTETFKKFRGQDPFNDIYGQENAKKQILSALIMNRHIVLVGPPGIGKTTFAKNVAKLLPEMEVEEIITKKKNKLKGEERFIRIQGSPDLTVEDMIGDIDPVKAMQFGPLSIESFTPGKIFKANKGVLFFDEINRAPEKLQNALLQVLEEGKATIGGYDLDLEADFVMIATMNPEDFAATEKLSEVLLDRFDFVFVGYPESLDIEKRIVREKSEDLPEVEFPDSLLNLTLQFIRELRNNENLERVPSVRASIGLYERSQSNAYLANKNKVDIKDIIESFYSVVSHRIRLKPSVKYLMNNKDFIIKEFAKFKENFERETGEDLP
ncbi:AAA family ATPase [Candidatus Woesearchaeota archaeon]|nr:AAA family ATPase [Candidatus Woesearchaeota archaeon]